MLSSSRIFETWSWKGKFSHGKEERNIQRGKIGRNREKIKRKKKRKRSVVPNIKKMEIKSQKMMFWYEEIHAKEKHSIDLKKHFLIFFSTFSLSFNLSFHLLISYYKPVNEERKREREREREREKEREKEKERDKEKQGLSIIP